EVFTEIIFGKQVAEYPDPVPVVKHLSLNQIIQRIRNQPVVCRPKIKHPIFIIWVAQWIHINRRSKGIGPALLDIPGKKRGGSYAQTVINIMIQIDSYGISIKTLTGYNTNFVKKTAANKKLCGLIPSLDRNLVILLITRRIGNQIGMIVRNTLLYRFDLR